MNQKFPPTWTKPILSDEQRANLESWCNELEATTKSQTSGALRKEDRGFCCLGILCDQIDPLRWVLGPDGTTYCFDNEEDVLPLTIARSTGITADCMVPDGRYKGSHAWDAVVLNDNCGLTFKEIASVIRWAYLDGERPSFYSEDN